MDNFKFNFLSQGQLESLSLDKFLLIGVKAITCHKVFLETYFLPLLLECCAEIILIRKNTYSLQRCRVGNKAAISTVPEKSEAATSFLRLGLLSTLIRNENEAFPKTFFKQPELGRTGFSICRGWKTSEHC